MGTTGSERGCDLPKVTLWYVEGNPQCPTIPPPVSALPQPAQGLEKPEGSGGHTGTEGSGGDHGGKREQFRVFRPIRPLTGGNHRSQRQVATLWLMASPWVPVWCHETQGQTGPLGAIKWDRQRAEPRIVPHLSGPTV